MPAAVASSDVVAVMFGASMSPVKVAPERWAAPVMRASSPAATVLAVVLIRRLLPSCRCRLPVPSLRRRSQRPVAQSRPSLQSRLPIVGPLMEPT